MCVGGGGGGGGARACVHASVCACNISLLLVETWHSNPMQGEHRTAMHASY